MKEQEMDRGRKVRHGWSASGVRRKWFPCRFLHHFCSIFDGRRVYSFTYNVFVMHTVYSKCQMFNSYSWSHVVVFVTIGRSRTWSKPIFSKHCYLSFVSAISWNYCTMIVKQSILQCQRSTGNIILIVAQRSIYCKFCNVVGCINCNCNSTIKWWW